MLRVTASAAPGHLYAATEGVARKGIAIDPSSQVRADREIVNFPRTDVNHCSPVLMISRGAPGFFKAVGALKGPIVGAFNS
jgi:hypothetical protein